MGKILAERQLEVTGTAQEISFTSFIVSIPAGAYPVGSRLTARLLTEPGLPFTDLMYVDDYGRDMPHVHALQLLPSGLSPDKPLSVLWPNGLEGNRPLNVLHAQAGDTAWSVVSSIPTQWGYLSASFDITQGGLWSLGRAVVPSPTSDGGAPHGDGG